MEAKWTSNRLTEILGISVPIVQGPLGGLSSQRLTAKVSNYGGLGSFGAHGLKPGGIAAMVDEIRGLTDRPFSMNLWVSMEDEGAAASDERAFQQSLASISGHILQFKQQLPKYSGYEPTRFEDQAQVLIDRKVPVFSFIYGIPDAPILDQFRRNGTKLIGTATTVEEAIALDGAGVDVIVASGFEAGGHRGSFLRPSEDSLTGTFSLVPQVVDAVKAPVLAAGGIADARGVVAALALGAEGVQMGTAFLACEESGANLHHRQTILQGKARSTGLTRGFTGRLARGIRNQLLEELNRKDVKILPYPLQRHLIRHLSIPAEAAGETDLMPLWAGQSANLSRCTDVHELLDTIVTDVSRLNASIQQWSMSVHHDDQS